MRGRFGFNPLMCPRCGSRMRLLATIEQREVIDRILRHLGLPTEIPAPRPPRAPPVVPRVPNDLPAYGIGADLPVFDTSA